MRFFVLLCIFCVLGWQVLFAQANWTIDPFVKQNPIVTADSFVGLAISKKSAIQLKNIPLEKQTLTLCSKINYSG